MIWPIPLPPNLVRMAPLSKIQNTSKSHRAKPPKRIVKASWLCYAVLVNSNVQLLIYHFQILSVHPLATLVRTCSPTKLRSCAADEADALCPIFMAEPPGGVWGPEPLLMGFSAADPELLPPLGTDTWPGMALKDVERC